MVHPSLTTVALPKEQAGRAGVDLLLHLLEQPGPSGGGPPRAAHPADGARLHRPRSHTETRRVMIHVPDTIEAAAILPRRGPAHGLLGARLARRAERPRPDGPVPDKPGSAVTLNILDVAGNLQLTQGMIDEFVAKNGDQIGKVTYSKATAPELVGKVKAQQNAEPGRHRPGADRRRRAGGRHRAEPVGAAAAHVRGPAARHEGLPARSRGHAEAGRRLRGDGHLLPVRAADRVPAGQGADAAEDRGRAARRTRRPTRAPCSTPGRPTRARAAPS